MHLVEIERALGCGQHARDAAPRLEEDQAHGRQIGRADRPRDEPIPIRLARVGDVDRVDTAVRRELRAVDEVILRAEPKEITGRTGAAGLIEGPRAELFDDFAVIENGSGHGVLLIRRRCRSCAAVALSSARRTLARADCRVGWSRPRAPGTGHPSPPSASDPFATRRVLYSRW